MLYLVFDKNSDLSTCRWLMNSTIREKARKGEKTTGNFLLDYALKQFKENETEQALRDGADNEV